MGYAATKEVIIYWKPDKHFVIYRSHHFSFDEYNSCLSIEDKHTPGYLLLRKYHEGCVHNSDLLNLIPCEIDIKFTPFSDTKIITYEI